MCTSRRVVNYFAVKVDVQQKGAINFKVKNVNKCVRFIRFTFHPLLSYGHSYQMTMYVLVKFAFGFLVFTD